MDNENCDYADDCVVENITEMKYHNDNHDERISAINFGSHENEG